jgi:hypothetical protein
VVVGSEDVAGLIINTAAASTVAGRVVFKGARSPIDCSRVQIVARPIDNASPVEARTTDVRSDCSFEVRDVVEHSIRIEARLYGDDQWALDRVFAFGKDVTASGINVVPGERIDGVEVNFTSYIAVLRGVINGPSGIIASQGAHLFCRRSELARPVWPLYSLCADGC